MPRLAACIALGLVLLAISPAWSPASVNPVHQPYLQAMRGDAVTVLWSTQENLTGEVQYSTDSGFANSSRVPASLVRFFGFKDTLSAPDFYQYRADITGLTPGTVYYYRVLMAGTDITVPNNGFRTPAPGPFKFLSFGDSGLGTPQQRAIGDLMRFEPVDMVIHVGDIAYEDGTFDQFLNNHFAYYFTMMAHLPFFPCPGNHEYNSCGVGLCPPAFPYLSLHAPPAASTVPVDTGKYYSYDWGDVHFVALDANLLPAGSDAELKWFDQDLSATNAKWKIVYWHQTPYALSHHIDDPIDINAHKLFNPILERHGVQLVLTGHEHNYARTFPLKGDVPQTSGGTLYITSGGGGGSLHEVVPQPFVATGCTKIPATEDNHEVRPPAAVAANLCEASQWHYLRVEVGDSQIVVHAIDLHGVEFDSSKVYLAPSISPGGVVNTASYTAGIAPGGLISIFGQALGSDTLAAVKYPLPTALAGSSVTLNGTQLALFFVSPQQINAQLPQNFTGNGTLQVSTIGGVSSVPITVAATAPAVFPSGVLHHIGGAAVSDKSPAVPGEIVDIYLTGLGQVSGGTLDVGQQTPDSPFLLVIAKVTVDLGAGISVPPIVPPVLTPGFAGLYQVSIQLPPNLTTNLYPLRVIAQGSTSNTQNIQVKALAP